MATPSQHASPLSRIASGARNRYWLSGAMRHVRALPPARHRMIREYYRAAFDRIAVADQLSDESGAVAGMLLYREAMWPLVTALSLSLDPDFPTSEDEILAVGASPWDVVVDLHRRGHLPALPPRFDQARAALTTAHPLELDRLPPQALLDRRAVVHETVRHLRRLVEPRTPAELVSSRYLHIFATVAALGLVAFGVVTALSHPNVALHKPAGASSRNPNSTAPADSTGLTNGVIEPTYGIETAPGPGWAGVDLLGDTDVSIVKIFNRRDGQLDAGLPLTLETSGDGANFTAVETRTRPFSATQPWIYKAPPGTHFRFLRVRSNTVVALTEIEVY